MSNLRAVRDGLRVLRVILDERSNRRALRGRTRSATIGPVGPVTAVAPAVPVSAVAPARGKAS